MSHPNPSTALARVVIDELVRNGIDRVVLSPGSRSAPLALAAASRADLHLTVALDERSAGFHALGLALAGVPCAVIVTSGSAVANLFPAVVEASMAGVGLVLLTADRPPELRGVGANQTIDQAAIFGNHARLFVGLGPAEDRPDESAHWRSSVCRAVAAARGSIGRPGPVQVNVALREPLVPASDDGRTRAEPYTSDTGGRSGGAPWSDWTPGRVVGDPLPPEFVGLERGLVIGGVGADIDWCDRAAATLGWPLVIESSAGARPAQAISTAHHLAGASDFRPGHRPEAVLAVGRIGLSRPLMSLIAGASTVVVDVGQWSDASSAAHVVRTMPPALEPDRIPERSSGWRREWLEAERAARSALDAALDSESDLSELRIARDTARGATGSVLVVASSMPIRDLDAVLEPGSGPVISNRGASGIDGFVSTALGVAARSGHGVALAGDLSMLHDQNGFSIDPRPSAVFVVVDNDGGGIFSFLPQAAHPEHFERVFGTPHGRSFQAYADFHGLVYEHVADAEALAPTIVERREAGGLHLIHVKTDRGANVDAHRRVSDAVSKAVSEL